MLFVDHSGCLNHFKDVFPFYQDPTVIIIDSPQEYENENVIKMRTYT